MENNMVTTVSQDPASHPKAEREREWKPRAYLNKVQFEEAVQRLAEAFERHPQPPKNVFY